MLIAPTDHLCGLLTSGFSHSDFHSFESLSGTFLDIAISSLQDKLHRDGAATIYVSDVLPGDPDFLAVQWWGTQGGVHGLEPKPEGSARGKNIHGQYFEAAPGHALHPELPLSEALSAKWVALANQLGIAVEGLDKAQSRRDFIQLAYEAYLAKNNKSY